MKKNILIIIIMLVALCGCKKEQLAEHKHNLVHHEAVSPTCTKEGYIAYDECTDCDYTTFKATEKLEHDYHWQIVKDATIDETGMKVQICKNCSFKKLEEVIPQLNPDEIMYELNENKTGYIIKGIENKDLTTVNLVSTYNNLPVIEIADQAFYECRGLTSVTIPGTVVKIGIKAFAYCKNLTNIVIPKSVTSIGDLAFAYCTQLLEITIPGSVKRVPESLFNFCSNLKTVILLEGVTIIDASAFRKCKKLTKISIPNSVTSIGESAFHECNILKEITLPDSLTNIGNLAFYDCNNLISINIPKSVTTIGECAFAYCTKLTKIIIPNSVIKVGDHAFNNCPNLTIYCEASSLPNGWSEIWNSSDCLVEWNYFGH